MKKFFSLMFALVIASCAICTSCSGIGDPDPEEVMQKINSGEKLDEGDYNTMIDYINDFCDEGEYSDGSYESGYELGQQYPYFMAFGLRLEQAVNSHSDELENPSAARKAVSRLQRALGR